jgi:Domain of unknown function (DUF5679)
MLKRIFLLALVGVGVWMLYRLWQQRQEDFGGTMPLLAPLESYGGHSPPPALTVAPAARKDAPPVPPKPAAGEAKSAEAIVGYCARCKARRSISDAREETTDTGRRAARGTCSVCGAKMFTFLPNKTS